MVNENIKKIMKQLRAEFGLTAVQIRIRKLEKIKNRNYEKLSPEQLQALQIRKTEENTLLLRKSLGEKVDDQLAQLQQANTVDEDYLTALYELEKELLEEEAKKDAEINRKKKEGINLLIKE